MNTTIQIQANNQPAIIERILQTTRVRGFRLRRMEVHASPDEAQLRVRLQVSSERAAARLTRQLEKIVGVLEIGALSSIDADMPEAATG